MRNFTIEHLRPLTQAPLLGRKPKPFPGLYPTKVAWDLKYSLLPYGPPRKMVKTLETLRLRYCGKPSRYRALELYRLLTHPGIVIFEFWAAEFDAAGIIAWERLKPRTDSKTVWSTTNAYGAYHPHRPSTFSICGAFTRKFYQKRIGRFPLYSYHQKLSQEKIDSFYNWYEATFEQKLKRPRIKPMVVSTGGNFIEVAQEDS